MRRFATFALALAVIGASACDDDSPNDPSVQPIVFTAKVTEYLPDKPGLILTPVDNLKGNFPFDRVPVNLTGDDEAKKEKQLPLVLERLEKDLTLLVFASRRGANINAVAYTNGTWLRLSGRVEKDGTKEVTRWQFMHCETYFRRTLHGTTDELVKASTFGSRKLVAGSWSWMGMGQSPDFGTGTAATS